jgi:hypothetical protein
MAWYRILLRQTVKCDQKPITVSQKGCHMTVNQTSLCRILGSHTGGYEESSGI